MVNLNRLSFIYVAILLATSAVFIHALWQGRGSIFDYFELKERQKVLEATVASLEKEIENLETEIHKIQSSKEYARHVLRDKYHVTEENEKILFYGD